MDDMGRAIPFEELERFSKYKTWKERNLDTSGDIFITFDDNRDMIIQQLDYLLSRSQSTYLPTVTYDQLLEYGCWCNLLDENLVQGRVGKLRVKRKNGAVMYSACHLIVTPQIITFRDFLSNFRLKTLLNPKISPTLFL